MLGQQKSEVESLVPTYHRLVMLKCLRYAKIVGLKAYYIRFWARYILI